MLPTLPLPLFLCVSRSLSLSLSRSTHSFSKHDKHKHTTSPPVYFFRSVMQRDLSLPLSLSPLFLSPSRVPPPPLKNKQLPLPITPFATSKYDPYTEVCASRCTQLRFPHMSGSCRQLPSPSMSAVKTPVPAAPPPPSFHPPSPQPALWQLPYRSAFSWMRFCFNEC